MTDDLFVDPFGSQSTVNQLFILRDLPISAKNPSIFTSILVSIVCGKLGAAKNAAYRLIKFTTHLLPIFRCVFARFFCAFDQFSNC